MEFFRKYQRVILYTAGIFALVSFSITGAVLGVFRNWFHKDVPSPTIQVAGRTVKLAQEDFEIAKLLVRRQRALDPATVLPDVIGKGENDNPNEVFAVLRRVAIESGIEISTEEVDRAIEQALSVAPQFENDQRALARYIAGSTVAGYRMLLEEAMRIGTLIRLESLAEVATDDGSIAELLRDENEELLTLRVASLDKKSVQEEIEAEDVSDDDLRAWIAGLDKAEQQAQTYTDVSRYKIRVAGIELAKFEPAEFVEELDGREFSDDEITSYYDTQKFSLFRKPAPEKPKDGNEDEGKEGDGNEDAGKAGDGKEGDGEQKENGDAPDDQDGDGDAGEQDPSGEATQDPAGEATQDPDEPETQEPPQPQYDELDDELREAIRKRLEAEEVMRRVWGDVSAAAFTWITDEQNARDEADIAKADAQRELDEAKAKAEADGATAEDAAALEAAQTAFDAAEAAADAAAEAVKSKRAGFDAGAKFLELANGRAGFVVLEPTEDLVPADDFKDTEALGEWSNSWAVTGLTEVGQLSTQVQRTKSIVFEFQLEELDDRPLKALEDIREKARSDYFTKQADERAKERIEAFEERLLELAKAKIQERIDELEAERVKAVEERFTEWKDGLDEELARAREALALHERRDPHSPVYRAEKKKVESLEAARNDEEAQRAAIDEELGAETETEILEAAKKVYKDVLAEAAAADDAIEVKDIGPYSRSLTAKGLAKERYPEDVQYLFWTGPVRELEDDAVTDVLEDFTNRKYYLAAVTKVQKPTIADISRRELLARRAAAGSRRLTAATQSYTIEAVKKRYGYKEAESEPEIKQASVEPK